MRQLRRDGGRHDPPLVVAYPFFRCRSCKGNFTGMKHHSKAIAMRSV